MTIHRLKTWPPYCADIAAGRKRLDIRRDDRGFQVDDMIQLDEWDPATGGYTGNHAAAKVTHVLPGGQFGLEAGFVALSLDVYRTWSDGRAGPWDPDAAL